MADSTIIADNSAALSGSIKKFEISSCSGGGSADILTVAAPVELRYYESLLANSISLTTVIAETGISGGIVDTLPIRGGEETTIVIEDAQKSPTTLSFTLYVNRVRGLDPGTQKDIYSIDFSSKEFFANEQTRVVKRYDGKISDNIPKVLEDSGVLSGKGIEVDPTIRTYNFIGCDRKPFYICTWLASKSIPEKAGGLGGAAGYFFYETYDSFKFKSIDVLNTQGPKKKYIFNNTPYLPPGYDAKILNVNIDRDIDLQQNLTLGTYSNRSLFFDFSTMRYIPREYNVDDNQKDLIENTGSQDITWVCDEFRKPPSRLMSHILDVGVIPSGATPEEQLEYWKNNSEEPNYDAANTMVQSIMRYNQLFTIKTNIVIAGDFSLRAGDAIYCDFPALTVSKNKDVNQESGGIYIIASVCHRISPGKTYTTLSLIRDTFGRN